MFSQEWDERLEEDSLLVERILLLLRNILHVPANKQAEKVHVLHTHLLTNKASVPQQCCSVTPLDFFYPTRYIAGYHFSLFCKKTMSNVISCLFMFHTLRKDQLVRLKCLETF